MAASGWEQKFGSVNWVTQRDLPAAFEPNPAVPGPRVRNAKLDIHLGACSLGLGSVASGIPESNSLSAAQQTNSRLTLGDIFMIRISRILCAMGAVLSLGLLATVAYADGRDWNDGPVQNVTFIRTVDGHFDDYMHWLATTYKKQQESAKAAGLITRYEVLVAQPHNPQDADIILITEFKNWAALDHLGSKLDQVSAKVEGSVDAANKSAADRAKIRTVLGSDTAQVAELK